MKKINELDQKKAPPVEPTIEQKIEMAKSILAALERIDTITSKYSDHPKK